MEQQKIKGEVAANVAADLRERDRRIGLGQHLP